MKMIWAEDAQGAIGFQGNLLFSVPEDLKTFSKETKGHIVVMGRKTWDSLPEKFKPLPERVNVVLTRNPNIELPGAEVFTSFEDVLSTYGSEERDIWIIGGGVIYDELKNFADVLVITYIQAQAVNSDSFAPSKKWVEENFVVTSQLQPVLSSSGVWFSVKTHMRA